MRDPYELLAVPRSATADDIKKSFRRLAKELHPDANKHDPEAAARFAELSAAHEILGDEDTREAFDRGKIDAYGKPTRKAISPARPSKRHIAANSARVMLVAAITLIMRGSTPAEKIDAAGDRIASVWSELRTDEEQASETETEGRNHKALSEPRLELLIGRSQQLLSEGDAEAARNLLQPAAEAHDARAALALGATYDPFMLAILHAHGAHADVNSALDWYKKASQSGSRTAQQRLNLLTSVLTTFESTRGMTVSDHASRALKPKRRVVWVQREWWDGAP
jgi:TPR repeat protein